MEQGSQGQKKIYSHRFCSVLHARPSPSNQAKKIEGIFIGKENMKLPLFVDDMILYTEKPQGFTFKKLLEQMSLARMQDIRSIYKDQLRFYTLAANAAKMNRIPFIIPSKRTSPWQYSG